MRGVQIFFDLRDILKRIIPADAGSTDRQKLAIKRWRIIPADAGSTYRSTVSRPIYNDHPRGCGEHASSHGSRVPRAESSPRMRGALYQHVVDYMNVRIIPADAGSTSYVEMTLQNGRDHPPGCGEHRAQVPASP